MIQKQTKIKINDNSSIKIGQCIKVYQKKSGKISNLILLSVKTLRSNQKTNKMTQGTLLKALIIHTKYNEKNTIGNKIHFDQNCVIILNNQKEPLGSRIFGPITSIFRKQKNFKLLSLASNIL